MGKKYNKEYTTIQVSKEINHYIRKLCKLRGWKAASITEAYWAELISSSLSGSFI